ncbi:MAG: AAA family ATPase [Candidatus Micrarchaeaceae archaeon]
MEDQIKFIVFNENEISSALEKLRTIQQKSGIITKDIMDLTLGPKLSEYLIHNNYLDVVKDLGRRGSNWLQLSDKAIKLSFHKEIDIFEGIYGWEEYKAKFSKIISDPLHGYCGLLYGASRTGKTLFMESLSRINSMEVVHITGDSTSSFAGITALIKQTYDKVGGSNFIVVIDEIDKADKNLQGSPLFLSLFDADETRSIQKNKATKEGGSDSYYIRLPYLKIFAGANNLDNMNPFLLNRFDLVPFPDYTEESFTNTAMEMLMKKFHKPRELAFEMASYYAKHRRNMGEVDMNGSRYNTVEEFRQAMNLKDRNAEIVLKQKDSYNIGRI